jgi:hypothetical protein
MSDNNGAASSGLAAVFIFLYIVAIGWLIKISTFFYGWGHRRIALRKGWILSVASMAFGANILVFMATATALVFLSDAGDQVASMDAMILAYWWVYPASLAVLVTGGIFDATAGRNALERKESASIEELLGEE